MTRRAALSLFAALCASACHRSKDASPSAFDAPSSDAPTEARADVGAACGPWGDECPPSDASIEPPPFEAGPAPPGAPSVTRQTREDAVLDLLAGGEPSTRLPRAAVDPGGMFYEQQRERVAPEIWVDREAVLRAGSRGDARVGPIVADGPAPPNARSVVEGLRPGLRACYNQGLQGDPAMAGQVVVKVGLARNGEVATAAAEKTTGASEQVVRCLLLRVRQAEFERSGTDSAGCTLRFSITLVKNGK